MKVKFTQFFDVASDPQKFTTFTVKAGGEYVKMRCAPQFACYKYYKLGKVSIKLVPASTLPVDPTGLSYETGETTVDPRDMFNPGLVRITNGEDVADIGDMNRYYATLLDPRWFKFQLQQGFSRSAVPLVYNIGEIHQDSSPFVGGIVDEVASNTESALTYGSYRKFASTEISELVNNAQNNETYPMEKLAMFSPIQTGRVKLGWMPTDAMINMSNLKADYPKVGYTARVPEVDLITFVLPKAFKTKFYYRCFIESTVYFKEPVAVNPLIEWNPVTGNTQGSVYLPVDRFVSMKPIVASKDGVVPINADDYKFNIRRDN
ncbi:capsid protein [Porcine smacovirus-1]|nr:capsid protein [Porcine smacovirus-1]